MDHLVRTQKTNSVEHIDLFVTNKITGSALKKMISKFIALLMAVLIGNPMCCCVVMDVLTGEHADSSQVYSCCGSPEKSGNEQQNPEETDTCLCFSDTEELVSIEQPTVKKGPDGNEVPISLAHTNSSLPFPRVAIAANCISKWPPGSRPTLSVSERLALKSSYLY